MNLKFEPGSSEEKSIKWINYVENKILDVNNKISNEFNNGNSLIRAIEKTYGNNQAADQWTLSTAQSSEKSYLNVLLTPSEERSIGTSEIKLSILKKLLVKFQEQNHSHLILNFHLKTY